MSAADILHEILDVDLRNMEPSLAVQIMMVRLLKDIAADIDRIRRNGVDQDRDW